MIHFLKILSLNPTTKWLQWLFMRYKLRKSNKTLLVGYMSVVIKCTFSKENHIFPFAHLFNVKMGDFSYVGGYSYLKNATIGKFTSIASEVKIGLGMHPVDLVSTHPLFYAPKKEWSIAPSIDVPFEEYKEVLIGNDVWIGTRVIIMDGLKIGNGAIIAAGSVVTKDVPDFAIVGGVPAKILKYRFAPDVIVKVSKSEWWNWDDNEKSKYLSKFLSIKDFIDHLKSEKDI